MLGKQRITTMGLVLALLALGAAGCSNDSPTPASTPASAVSPTTAAPTTSTPTTLFPAEAAAIWLANPAASGLVRVDALDPDETSGAEIGFSATAVAVHRGLVWVGGDGLVAAVDPERLSIVGSTELDGPVSGLFPAADTMWALTRSAAVPIDVAGEEAGAAVPANEPLAAGFDDGSLWVAGAGDLVHIDTVTNSLISSYETGIADPVAVQVGAGAIVIITADGIAYTINPSDGSIANEQALTVSAIPPGGVVATVGGFWVADSSGQVVKLDDELDQELSIEVGSSAMQLTLAGGYLWGVGGNTLARIGLDDFVVLQFPLEFAPSAITGT